MLGLDLITIEKRKRIINDNRAEELSMLGEAQLVYLNSGVSIAHMQPLCNLINWYSCCYVCTRTYLFNLFIAVVL